MKLIAITALALAAGATLPVQSEGVEVGSTPAYEFRQPILNGMGAKSLADIASVGMVDDFISHLQLPTIPAAKVRAALQPAAAA